MHVIDDQIQEWLETGRAILVPADVAAAFGRFLDDLPWNKSGSALDWGRISGVSVDLSHMSGMTLRNWMDRTPLGQDPYIVFWFGRSDPAIACESDFAIASFDQVFWKAPGRRYLFGALLEAGSVTPRFEHFAEYDGADALTVAQPG